MSTSPFYELPVALTPQHPVSALAFAPAAGSSSSGSSSAAPRLLVASWDKTVRFYSLAAAETGSDEAPQQAQLLHTFEHEAAVLDVVCIDDKRAASASLDRCVRLLDLETGQSQILGRHGSGVNRVRYDPVSQLLLSTSWDSTLAIFSLSPPAQLHTLTLPAKPLAMDISPAADGETPRAVVAMTGRTVHIFEMHGLRSACDAKGEGKADEQSWQPTQTRESSLKYMVRDVRCMPNGQGYASASVEGRIAVEFFAPSPEAQAQKYAFKCHRQVVDGIDTVYPVNAMAFHPTHGTFASLGGDAIASVWDAAARKRRLQYARFPSPLTAAAVSGDGSLFALASGGENIEDARHEGADRGEVGGVGEGGEGNVRIHVARADDDFKPKAKTAAA